MQASTRRVAAFLIAAVAAAVVMPAAAGGVDVGVSIGISQPGVYGRVDIGRFPQPQVVVAQPVIVQRVPLPVVVHQPVPVVRQDKYPDYDPGRGKGRGHGGRYD